MKRFHSCSNCRSLSGWIALFFSMLVFPPASFFQNVQALHPIIVQGYKLFDSGTGQEFVVKGVDYFPRPNTGNLNHNSMDLYTEEYRHIWERDIKELKQLGVNAIRLYAVDANLDHDAFMCALDEAGIYVVVALARDCPTCAITRDESPSCYPPELKLQGQRVIQTFAKYDNTLAFSAGNEVNHFTPPGNHAEWNAPCQKRFLRDMRQYLHSCRHSLRQVPVGLVSADNERDALAMYYNCQENDNDPFQTAEWYGLNTYVFCDGKAQSFDEALGFKDLTTSLASNNYSIPLLLTEFGCLSDTFPTVDGVEGQRNFLQARWMLNQQELRPYASGGFAFEYSMEYENAHQDSPYPFTTFGKQAYGLGYLEPEHCDDINVSCSYHPLPSFNALKQAYTETEILDVAQLDSFQVHEGRSAKSRCPAKFPRLDSLDWSHVDSEPDLACPRREQFQCHHFDNPHPKSSGPEKEQEIFGRRVDWFILGLLAGVLVIVCLAFGALLRRAGRQVRTSQYMTRDSPSISSDEESAGVLSLKLRQSVSTRAANGGVYHSLASDSSAEGGYDE